MWLSGDWRRGYEEVMIRFSGGLGLCFSGYYVIGLDAWLQGG